VSAWLLRSPSLLVSGVDGPGLLLKLWSDLQPRPARASRFDSSLQRRSADPTTSVTTREPANQRQLLSIRCCMRRSQTRCNQYFVMVLRYFAR
jgi:hypothetical protein